MAHGVQQLPTRNDSSYAVNLLLI